MGKKILLAEDSLTIQKVFELTFRGTDVALTMVDNGEDAVRLAGEIAPDLVITDVTLPGKDGFEVASSLRQAEKTKSVPVLILAGTVAPFDEGRFKKSGADGVVFKPFESQEMVDKINGFLRGGTPARAEQKPGAPPKAVEETWDFSDVIEEVEDESSRPAPAPAAAPPRPEDLLGVIAPPAAGKGPATLNEFDVSLEDLEGAAAESAGGPAPPLQEISHSFDEALEERKEEPAPPPDDAGAPTPSLDLHLEGDLFQDSPSPVTDLTAALDSAEGLADLEIEAELSSLGKEIPESPPPRPEAPPHAPPPARPSPEEPARRAEGIQRPMGTIPQPVESKAKAASPPPRAPAAPKAPPAPVAPAVSRTPVVPRAPAAPAPPASIAAQAAPAGPRAGQDARTPEGLPDPLQEAFAARTREIIEKVAAETVERVLWDVVDRWSEEFSARIREAVETVAWEVIPQAADTVIREEISRIRGQSEKKSS